MYFLAPHSRTPLPPCLAHRYALFYLLREIGSLRGPMGEFIDSLRAAGSPSQQLRLLNAYRPAELAAVGAGEEHWDAAVYSTLDRATLLKRLLRGAAYGGSAAGSGSSTPSSSSVASSSSGVGGMPAFGGPVAAVLPRDRLGAMMLEATRRNGQAPTPRRAACCTCRWRLATPSACSASRGGRPQLWRWQRPSGRCCRCCEEGAWLAST